MAKEKIAIVGIKKEDGYLYFVDKEGDISRAPLTRGKRKIVISQENIPPAEPVVEQNVG